MRVTAVLLAALLTVVAAWATDAQGTPRAGGVLKVASIGEPPTLDESLRRWGRVASLGKRPSGRAQPDQPG